MKVLMTQMTNKIMMRRRAMTLIDDTLQLFVKKGKGAIKKESARISKWPKKVLDDFIDIVASSNSYKIKLIFTNCKNQKNGPIYEDIRRA